MNDREMYCSCDAAPGNQPHRHRELQPEPPILNNILDHIGNTPLVRLDRIAKAEGLQCELLAKCEYFNAGGSVKDRIAHRILEEAEADGLIKPGFTIIEATSGNTGIGLALSCAVKGYKCIITLPEKMSQEKVDILRALGAQIIRTPTEAAWDSPQSHISVAKRLHEEIPNSIILGQYTSPYNPVAHYDGTAEEILRACNDQLDMLVVAAGTGGTLTGIARKIKERCPECIIVGVDPVGSILAQPESLNQQSSGMYFVEGIGYDFIPDTLDRSMVDHWIKITDNPSFAMARRLIREEGLLCGGSSGGAVWAAVEAARSLGRGKRVVTILPDSVRNYMTRFLNDGWMERHGFLDRDEELRKQSERNERWHGACVKDLNLKSAVVIEMNTPVLEAVELMKTNGFDQLPVISARGILRGIVTLGNVLSRVTTGRVTSDAKVSDVMFRFQTSSSKKFREITPETPLAELDHFFENNIAGIVTIRLSIDDDRVAFMPVHVITAVDLLTYLISTKN
ncbi:cystathionine beta-synthase [Coemansia thaxteri]|uniref:Cystathionine beta-synthase n=1 Tax=Coemansia thaxteri TaxID=2663907 RepID=A0A9W8BFL8_9FUNG|nr:cystathionine beta-synthase [Coemansia thaxteri]KAJ2009876.1 cystathionine beta-synthase [Coemansia thaxteri]KAJ2474499.1 cystathionine beta-synthase [Coemansia sp. RSA 2322]KAJ2485657.1 cystathionine beta-synthase [Coemansia sp. RSA 2320]